MHDDTVYILNQCIPSQYSYKLLYFVHPPWPPFLSPLTFFIPMLGMCFYCGWIKKTIDTFWTIVIVVVCVAGLCLRIRDFRNGQSSALYYSYRTQAVGSEGKPLVGWRSSGGANRISGSRRTYLPSTSSSSRPALPNFRR
jgi:hypothetical protein